MVVFSKKLNSFSGEATQHGRPLQTPLVSLIKYVNNLYEKSDEVKLRELLNINPPCVPEYTSKAIDSICMFIR